MRGSIRAVVAATVALLGLGQGPADAAAAPPTPGIGTNICDGYTGMCTNPIFVRPVMFYADVFKPKPGGLPHPQVWSVGRLKVAEDQDPAGAGDVFAVGHLRVTPFATGFFSISTVAWGRWVKSNNPDHPYRFEGLSLSHDPDAMRGQDFEFIGEQTGPVPPGPENPPGR
jgi:hypothetical protein